MSMSDFVILSDTREQKNKHVLDYFESIGQPYAVSKLYVGDYAKANDNSIAIDKKKDLNEIESNIVHQHERFKAECIRAQEAGIRLIILCEHGGDISTLEDVSHWKNPRVFGFMKKIRKAYNIPSSVKFSDAWEELRILGIREKPPIGGERLHKAMVTMSERYGVEWVFCSKSETGAKITELLGGNGNGSN